MTTIERAALALWAGLTGLEPQEPLRTRGGALDPAGWSMKTAQAVADGKPTPKLHARTKAPTWAREMAEEIIHAAQ